MYILLSKNSNSYDLIFMKTVSLFCITMVVRYKRTFNLSIVTRYPLQMYF